MDREGTDEQEPTGSSWKKPRTFLLLAALVAALAIAFSASRDERAGQPPPVAAPAGMADTEAMERQAAATPKDAGVWQRLGRAYFDGGRFADAVRAYRAAVQLDSARPELWSALGEAQVMVSRTDPLPAEAAASFAKALALDPKDPRARYFMAVKKDLAGDHAGAIDAWLALLADTPKGAVWEADLRRTIEQVGKINRIEVAARLASVDQPQPSVRASERAVPGPSAQDLAAAATIPPGEQREMAEGMVARLEARLAGDPRNVDGWIMLMRSRVTLGERDKAAKALHDAVAANPGQADLLRRQAATLGVR
jgi:cytochrome c-type biogenesis protein CcmH